MHSCLYRHPGHWHVVKVNAKSQNFCESLKIFVKVQSQAPQKLFMSLHHSDKCDTLQSASWNSSLATQLCHLGWTQTMHPSARFAPSVESHFCSFYHQRTCLKTKKCLGKTLTKATALRHGQPRKNAILLCPRMAVSSLQLAQLLRI